MRYPPVIYLTIFVIITTYTHAYTYTSYNNALKENRYTHLEYTPPQPKRNNSKRNIIWFSPPYTKPSEETSAEHSYI